jgi:hypothetical protein
MSASRARISRRRYRRAGEPLTEDSSLRDALTDEQAGRLLDWGLTQVKQKVEATLEMPHEEAATTLEEYSHQVRQVMREVNQLVETLPQAEESEGWTQLLAFSQSLHKLDVPHLRKEATVSPLFRLEAERDSLDQATLFERLLVILQPEEANEAPN